MCEICHRNPCLNRCPNSPDPKIRGSCDHCGKRLREDYEYYTDNEGNKFCSDDCALEYHGIKSMEWDYEDDDWLEV